MFNMLVCVSTFVRTAEGYSVAQYDVERGPEMDFMTNGGFRLLLETYIGVCHHHMYHEVRYVCLQASSPTQSQYASRC